ncbi:GH92 family glycosyl hydrolase [Botrimarina sp.]|uniref:GH92 family glycosyl hydrolase n=1 Tax=Botrimarina sp. TaxID=2795802 RepID=UPI0032EF3FE5
MCFPYRVKLARLSCVAFLLLGPASLAGNNADWVNPLVGTDSTFEFSQGNTYPAVAAPHGMTFWTPRTGDHTGWIYQYGATRLRGFQATHQPSPWMGDYGQFSLMPFLEGAPLPISSAYSHEEESAHPYEYRVRLADFDIGVAMTSTTRCGVFRIDYPDAQPCRILLDVCEAGEVEVDASTRTVRGTARTNQGGVEGDFGCRFVADFDCPIELVDDSHKGNARRTCVLRLRPSDGRSVTLKIGTSFISHDQAATNLRREVGASNYDQVRSRSRDAWNNRLACIQIEGATPHQCVTFYSCLYRFFLFPRILHEVDDNGATVHYSPYSGRVEPGEMYADNGFWDTFRAVYPLLSLIDPDLNASIIRGWINAYREGGWFPKWASPGYRDCMIGTHVESLIADALSKGIDDFDVDTALAGCLRDATVVGDKLGVGRRGLAPYLELGYVPCDEVGEATARTLEFAYDDWCVAQVALATGRDQAAAALLRRAQNYRNVFDSRVGFMRGRLRDGSWREPFAADEWGGPFTEGSAWHYSWSVLHDVPGLIGLMGGDHAFIDKLDAMLDADPTFGIGHYGREIHEMTEMVAGGMGQYAHGNQPVHHVLYLYSFAGAPWKGADPIRRVVDELYGPGPDGYCGDEDNGQMSAWYLFSTLGFYPVCPGEPGYVIGSPRFERATIRLPEKKTLVLETPNVSDANRYVTGVELNGLPLSRSWIEHDELAAGGRLRFAVADQPDKAYGQRPDARPFERSEDNARR